MADGEDIQPLVCDNGTGMVKVIVIAWYFILLTYILVGGPVIV